MGFLQDKIILVTGAASGIGAAARALFAEEGAVAIGLDIQGGANLIQADVASRESMGEAVDQILARHGRIDGAFLNAGIEGLGGRMAPIADWPEEEFARVIAVNQGGVWNGLRAILPPMIARKSGAIVITSSFMGARGMAGMPAYTASKHAVLGLMRCAAIEAAPAGVRVNAIAPGAVATPMLTERAFQVNAGFTHDIAAQRHPIGRIAQPREIAEAAAWLLCDRASFVAGHVLAVDGGLSAT